MKKFSYLFACASLLILLPGCKKLIDWLHSPDGSSKRCRIATAGNGQASYRFVYDSQGSIDSIVPNATDGNQYVFDFNYNTNGRLRQLIYDRSSPFLRHQHQYGYTSNRITADTVYVSGNFLRGWACALEYDSQGRIIHETRTIFYTEGPEGELGHTDEIFYQYDHRGNLMARNEEPLRSYDDSPSLLRTDSILMFLARDYSRNNRTGASNFNSAGWPQTFEPAYPFVFFPQNGIDPAIIPVTSVTYDCK
jgi:hypothetical protein